MWQSRVRLLILPLLGLCPMLSGTWAIAQAETSAPDALITPRAGASGSAGLNSVWAAPRWQIGNDRKEAGLAAASTWEWSGDPPLRRQVHYIAVARAPNSTESYTELAVLKLGADGNQVTSYGTNGWKTRSLIGISSNEIVAAAFPARVSAVDSLERVYFIGPIGNWPPANKDMLVVCFDLYAPDAHCDGWPPSSYLQVDLALGGNNHDIPQAVSVTADGHLWVAGAADSGGPQPWLAILKLHASDGSLDSSFGSGGIPGVWLEMRGQELTVHSVLEAPLGNPAWRPLCFAGASISGTDASRTGFLACSYDGGGFGTGMGNGAAGNDAGYSALSFRGNGSLLWAGWMTTSSPPDANFPALAFGCKQSDYDGPLCQDICDDGYCAVDQGSVSSSGFMKTRPRAIRELADTGEILLALDGGFGSAVLPMQPSQRLQIWNGRGTELRASVDATYPSDSGILPAATVGGIEVFGKQITMAGTRRWNADDDDVTAARYDIVGDFIFEDSFEQ